MAKQLHTSAREVQTIAGNQLRNPQAQNRRHVARMVIVFILGKFSFPFFIFILIGAEFEWLIATQQLKSN